MKTKKLYRKTIITLYIVSPIICILSALVFILQSTISFQPINQEIPDYSHVLKDQYNSNNNFGNLKINEIAMLGSHDSCAYAINKNQRCNPNEDTIFNKDFVRGLARGIASRNAKAQKDDIEKQFKAGARYFDFRITYVDNQYYTCHMLLSNALSENLLQMMKCLDENPGEFVYINMQHIYYPSKDYTYTHLREYISTVKYKGKNLYDFVPYKKIRPINLMTYNDITYNGTKSAALLYIDADKDYVNPTTDFYEKYFTLDGVCSDWANTMSNDKLTSTMSNLIDEVKNKEKGKSMLKVNQAQKTPSGVNYITSWDLLTISNSTNQYLLTQKLDLIKESLKYLPVYMSDYCTSIDNDFVNKINKLIIENNKTLL